MTGLDRERAIEQPLRPAEPLVPPGFVIAVEEFENERRGHASQTIGAGRLNFDRLLEQTARLDHRRLRRRQVEHRLAAHDEVDEFGAVRPFAPASPRFDIDDLQADRARNPAHDLVLNLQNALQLRVKTLGPQLACLLSLDQPRVDAHALAVEDHAALEQITNLQLAADLPRVCTPALIGERRVAGDDGDPGQRVREVADEAVRNSVGQVVPLGIAAEIRKRKNDDGWGRRVEPVFRGHNLACHGTAVFDVRRGG